MAKLYISLGVAWTVGLGVVVLAVMTGGSASRYDEALLLTYLGAALFMTWPPWVHACFYLGCAFCYDLALVVSGTLGPPSLWASNNAILWTAAITAIVGYHLTYKLRLKEFTGRRLLDESHRLTEATLERLRERDASIQEDLQEAKSFQSALFRAIPELGDVAFSLLFTAAEAVGGDFFDVTAMAQGHYRILILDVTGHGVQAAFRTMALKAVYDQVKQSAKDPQEVLRLLNNHTVENHRATTVTYCAACLDLTRSGSTWQVTYCNAGLPLALGYSERKLAPIACYGAYQGVFQDPEYEQVVHTMQPGERIFLYTDGLVDQTDAKAASFDAMPIIEQACSTGRPVKDLISEVERRMLGHPNGDPIKDDVTLIAVHLG